MLVRPFAGLGRRYGWLWVAHATSSYGTWLGFGAFTVIAIEVLHAGAAEVALLAASGPAVGALLALPLGPWIEFRLKRPVMIATDVLRCVALASIPVAYALDALSVGQLLAVSVLCASAAIAFTAAGGAFLKALVDPVDLLVANARFESTTWSASVLGPALGGAAIGLFGPVVTVLADAVSHLLSALGLAAIGRGEPAPTASAARPGLAGLAEGWRHLLGHRDLRRLFLNSVLVNGLIMAAEPPLAVLMLGPSGFAPWQYGLAFSVPCLGGLVGSRLARPIVARYGTVSVLRVTGWVRVLWPVGLVLVGPGWPGLLTVIVVELLLIVSCSIFGPVSAAYRLRATDDSRVSRVLGAWSITSALCRAILVALWGVLATLVGPRWAIGAAGALLLATPALLPLPSRRLGGPGGTADADPPDVG